jgi:hypothetical protein
MKKKVFCIITVFLISYLGKAQIPSFDYAASHGTITSSGETRINQIVPSNTGGYYVTGSFYGTVTFGTYTLTPVGYEDVFVAKIDAAGNYQWVAQAGGTNTDVGNSLAVDSNGNVYVAGNFKSLQATFGGTTLAHTNGNDNTFVAKLSPTGSWLWATQTAGGSYSYGDFAVSIALDATGNVYVAGQFISQKLVLGSITLTNSDPSIAYNRFGRPDLYVAKLSSTGTWLWAVSGGGTSDDVAASLAVDPAGNIYLAGSFESATAKFGNATLTKSGFANTIVAKLDGTGNWLWVSRAGGSAYCYPASIAVDANGQPYIAGRFTLSSTFGAYTVGAVGYYDAFVAKLGAGGIWQWVATCGGSAADSAVGLSIDNQGNVYIAGTFLSPTMTVGTTTLTGYSTKNNNYEVFAAKLDAQSTWQWAVQATGSGDDIATSGALDGLGRFWLAGYSFGPSIQFGTNTITNPGVNNSIGFVARLSSQVLATQASNALTLPLTVSPNPSHGTVWIRGAVAKQAVQLYDVTGRLVLEDNMPSGGALQLNLPLTLPAGVYIVRSGSRACRLVVE